ncbi:hypothetical protein [Helicobacter pylori]|nr:hypothetical protein [Helicobacter pylori]
MWNRPLFLKQGAFALTNANAKGSLRSAWAFPSLKRGVLSSFSLNIA